MRLALQKSAVLITVLAAIASCPARALAEMSESEYREALRIASEEAQRRQRLRESRAGAVSSSVLRELFGRYYEKGDSWVVAAYREDSPMMRMTSDPAHLERGAGEVGIFRYEVVRVQTGLQPEVELRVTQVSAHGIEKKADPRVEHLALTMNDRLSQSAKEYAFAPPEGAAERFSAKAAVKVSPDGIRSPVTPLELFPLDVPDVFSARDERTDEPPVLPEGLEAVARRAGFRIEPARVKAFEQEDFFGRPVRILWRQGEPWPAYLKTPQGVAILLSSEAR